MKNTIDLTAYTIASRINELMTGLGASCTQFATSSHYVHATFFDENDEPRATYEFRVSDHYRPTKYANNTVDQTYDIVPHNASAYLFYLFAVHHWTDRAYANVTTWWEGVADICSRENLPIPSRVQAQITRAKNRQAAEQARAAQQATEHDQYHAEQAHKEIQRVAGYFATRPSERLELARQMIETANSRTFKRRFGFTKTAFMAYIGETK